MKEGDRSEHCVDLLIAEARDYLETGEPARAVGVLETALESFPADEERRRALREMLESARRQADAPRAVRDGSGRGEKTPDSEGGQRQTEPPETGGEPDADRPDEASGERSRAAMIRELEHEPPRHLALERVARPLQLAENKQQKRERNEWGWNLEWDPESLWIRNGRVEGGGISVEGRARNHDDVAEYLQRVESAPYLSGAKLDYVRPAENEEGEESSTVAFRIFGMQLPPPEESNPRDRGKGSEVDPEDRIPEDPRLAHFAKELHDRAKSRGLFINSFRQITGEYRGDYSEHTITMQLDGSYGDLAEFLEAVGAFDRLVQVRTMTVEKVGRDATDIRATVEVVAYSGSPSAE